MYKGKEKSHLRMTIDKKTKDKLKKLADAERRSMTGMVEYLIDAYFEKKGEK